MNRKLARLSIMIIDLLLFTCRIEIKGRSSIEDLIVSGKFIYASWHGRLIVFFLAAREHQTAVMTSRSKDGTVAAAMQSAAGCTVFRGSSRKGGSHALEEMTDYMKTNNQPAILSVDGPTGPMFKAKPGIVKLSQDTGFPIVPITFSGKNVTVFKSWDRCMIPKPFSKCTLLFGEPVYPSENLKETLSDLNKKLNTLTRDLDGTYGHHSLHH